MRFTCLHPTDTVFSAALHFHDMGNGMVGPTVTRVERDGFKATFFGACVIVALFKTKGMHADQGVVAGV